MQTKKNTHGGAGRGQGRKKGVKTDTISFRTELSLKRKFYAKYEAGERSQLLADFIRTLIET